MIGQSGFADVTARELPVRQSFCNAPLTLATRAVVSGTLPLHDLADRSVAGTARFAGTAVYGALNLEATETAVALHVVAQGRAAGANRLRQHRAHCRNKFFATLAAESPRGDLGIEARQ